MVKSDKTFAGSRQNWQLTTIECTSYIPPKSSTDAYNVYLNNAQLLIENLSPTQHVLHVGDFNLGSIIWNNARANTFTADRDSELLLLEFISQDNLCQVSNILLESYEQIIYKFLLLTDLDAVFNGRY